MTGTDKDLFHGFEARSVATPEASIFARIGGSGPPLLLLHGYPQTHVCWHRVAPRLAERFTVVAADLRGYGRSSCPAPDDRSTAYSKRAMGGDMRAVMQALGFPRFCVAGHDRGARVAYRLALDHPDAVDRLVLLDIIPTAEVWRACTAELALKSYHWPFLAQPHPLPERLIGADPAFYVAWTLASWTAAKDLSPFDPAALAQYRTALHDPARIRAVCEDYRAGAGLDRALDEADLAAGRRIAAPTLVLWGSDYVGRGGEGPLAIWQRWCTDVRATAVRAGHFLAEENAEATLAAMLEFLDRP